MNTTQDHFLSDNVARELFLNNNGEAMYVVSRSVLTQSAKMFVGAMSSLPYGGKVKYAVKANPHPELVKIITECGVGIDASSFYEAELALQCGVEGKNISLTSQELPPNDESFKKIIDEGIEFNATSMHQLKEYVRLFPGKSLGVRINPGLGSGMNNRLTTGGASASFGIWYEYIPEILSLCKNAGTVIARLHTHIGSGTDPMEWISTLETTLDIAERLPDVTNVSIGGGFKSRYMPGEHDADMTMIAEALAKEVEKFKVQTGREMSLEIEPGRFMVVHAGAIVARIIDKTDTGENGHQFLRVNTGMTEILRPAMYGAQHGLRTVSSDNARPLGDEDHFVVAGHCCESSDCLTTVKGDPEQVEPRLLQNPEIGDILIIEDTGAYCYGMSAIGYNGYPAAKVLYVE